jgi:probable rRNA maturation factor
MTYHVHILSYSEHSDYENRLTQVAVATLDAIKAPSGELSLVLGDEEQVRDLNRKYRNLDRPTDVLSFKHESSDPDSGLTYFGDVIIAVPIAEIQAGSAGHSVEAELSLLTVHGILHLLEYDHSDEEEKVKMWKIQSKILRSLNLNVNEPR